MSTNDFLRLQLRLLISQFGRRAVVDALAGLSDLLPEQIEAELAAHDSKKRQKTRKPDKSLEQLLASLALSSEEVKSKLTQIGRLYETKQFLPNLRDAEKFLHRSGAPSQKFKSRTAALGSVLKAISAMPPHEIDSLLTETVSTGGQSDYSLLANQLMGKGR